MNSSSPSLTSKRWKWQRLLTTTGWQTLKRPTLSTCAWSQLAQPPLSFTGLQKRLASPCQKKWQACSCLVSFLTLSCSNRQLPTHQIRRWPQNWQRLRVSTWKNTVWLSSKRVPTWPASRQKSWLTSMPKPLNSMATMSVSLRSTQWISMKSWNARKKLKLPFQKLSLQRVTQTLSSWLQTLWTPTLKS